MTCPSVLRYPSPFASPPCTHCLFWIDECTRQLVYSERDEDDGRRSSGELLDERDVEADEARHVLEAEAGSVDRVLGRVLTVRQPRDELVSDARSRPCSSRRTSSRSRTPTVRRRWSTRRDPSSRLDGQIEPRGSGHAQPHFVWTASRPVNSVTSFSTKLDSLRSTKSCLSQMGQASERT